MPITVTQKQRNIAVRNARFATALDNAYAAATAAVAGMVENTRALNCGFAWVTTHDRTFNEWCRKQVIACDMNNELNTPQALNEAKRKYGTANQPGRMFWSPARAPVQQVDIHEAGAKAFSNSLAHELQIRCEWSSRLD